MGIPEIFSTTAKSVTSFSGTILSNSIGSSIELNTLLAMQGLCMNDSGYPYNSAQILSNCKPYFFAIKTFYNPSTAVRISVKGATIANSCHLRKQYYTSLISPSISEFEHNIYSVLAQTTSFYSPDSFLRSIISAYLFEVSIASVIEGFYKC